MKKTLVVFIMSVLLPVVLPSLALSAAARTPGAERHVRDIMVESLTSGTRICAVVEDMIGAGYDVSEVVEDAVLMGHPACVVVRCAIEAGGRIEDVITAAFRAGATPDVVVTCAVEGGASPDVLARVIDRFCAPGFGYTPPAESTGYTPSYTAAVSGGGGGVAPVSRFSP